MQLLPFSQATASQFQPRQNLVGSPLVSRQPPQRLAEGPALAVPPMPVIGLVAVQLGQLVRFALNQLRPA